MEIHGCVYGTINAPRLWYRVIVGFLISDGWTLLKMDVAMLVRYDSGKLTGLIVLHVDDFVAAVKPRLSFFFQNQLHD